ncbi:PEPxxWA-CTERM sorting domain-containing protein [Gimibacter soli]|uniref:PEPxxWA-CTERM sorting domain-containing protein n=1 Tax=Gimibacter soli TaxID=3024400 RepID=A0AAE9XNU2_9PROT|nr:PEPxxWA-CTERM sorting domain-containing protein [Gimibacter soli]WCL53809.1 PEPxxWA-CTERM sorting domain-containing protein [Gimibacter soli]
MIKKALVGLGLALGLATGASASVSYTVDSGWRAFSWSGNEGTFTSEGGFTFDVVGAAELTLTDAYSYGDIFEVFDDGSSLGLTSIVPSYDAGKPNVGSNMESAISNGFSQGTFYLSAGSYLIDFSIYQSAVDASGAAYGSGGAFFRVDSIEGGVPEPATWLMMIMGFGLVGVAASRKRLATA